MPLVHGSSREAFVRNLKTELAAGRPKPQALAIAYSEQRRHPKAFGGALPHRDMGGAANDASPLLPTTEMQTPQAQGLLGQIRNMPPEKLRELSLRYPPTTQQGQMIQRLLMQRQVMPNAGGQQAFGAQPGAPPLAPQAPTVASSASGGFAAGGDVHKDMGGGLSPGMESPWWERSSERAMISGPLTGGHGGRTDTLKVSPLSGSYVVPADVVSGIGEGDSEAGARIMQNALSTGPWGTPLPHGGGMRRPPAMHALQFQSRGGATPQKRTPILAAGGELIIHPRDVARIGGGSIDRGHKILDHWVVRKRKQIIEEMKKLPGPAKD